MKRILYIELCNFQNYPLGGHLSFAVHLTTAMEGDIDLVGITTEKDIPIGEWTKKEIAGVSYNFYSVYNITPSFKRPLIPRRITDYLQLKRHISKIFKDKEYDIIIVQTPEVLLAIPDNLLSKVCLIMPGIENPLVNSRYVFARKFAEIYDKVFFSRAANVNCILPAADNNAIKEFIERSKGKISKENVFQFPTRYDGDIFPDFINASPSKIRFQ